MSSLGATATVENLPAKHSTRANASFWFKSRLLIARRLVQSAITGELFHSYRRMAAAPNGTRLLARDEHRLYSASDSREHDLELGKVQNLRIAAAAIDGIILEPGDIFSFWLAAGRPRRRNGYVIGRELRNGCMIPSVGGAFANSQMRCPESPTPREWRSSNATATRFIHRGSSSTMPPMRRSSGTISTFASALRGEFGLGRN